MLGQKIAPAGESLSDFTAPEPEPVTDKPAERRKSLEFDVGVAMSPGSALAMHEVKGAMGMRYVRRFMSAVCTGREAAFGVCCSCGVARLLTGSLGATACRTC